MVGGAKQQYAQKQNRAVNDRKSSGDLVTSLADGEDEISHPDSDGGMATATTNSHLRHVNGNFGSLVDGLEYAAKGNTGCNFFSAHGALERTVTWTEVRDQAKTLAQAFDRAGFQRGSRMAIVAETNAEVLFFFFACQYAGLLPVTLPLSMNLSGRDEYVLRLAKFIAKADARFAVGSADLIDFVHEAAPHLEMAGTPENYFDLPFEGGRLRPFDADELCYIQFSSGSTSDPRGVTVSQRSVTTNIGGIMRHALKMREGDRFVSWLPLYHDMGLVGFCLTPMLGQFSIDYLSTTSFARRPLVWLKIMSEHGGNIAFSPNFGYDLCARRGIAQTQATTLNLRHWRVAGIGGDMIYPETLERFANAFTQAGFSPKAFLPSYGQAEMTLATTFAPLDTDYDVDYVSRDELANSRRITRASADGHKFGDEFRPFVKCGKPLPGHDLEIRNEDGSVLADDRIGRIMVRGPSQMVGYHDDPVATAAVMYPDGWMDTGDLGYLSDGQLVVTGRQKDIIILYGKNIWPQDIELAVAKLERIRSRDVACFSAPAPGGGEQIIVVVQCRVGDKDDRKILRKSVSAAANRVSGAGCQVIFVPPGTLPFTSSGKLSRAGAAADFIAGKIVDLESNMDEGSIDESR